MRLLIPLLALALAACDRAPVVIDGSSPEAFAKTTEKARRDLPIKDRLTFDTAIKSAGSFADKDPDAAARLLYNGMTAREGVESR